MTTPTNPPPFDPTRLRARHDQLLREAKNAERYSHWKQAGRLRREAREIALKLREHADKVA